jgi:hypothetical protein
VKKYTRGSYTSLATNWTIATQHTLTGITSTQINSYGICLGCHDGVKQSKVAVWHARPDRFGGVNWGKDCTKAVYAAGRSSSGIGRFNIFDAKFKGQKDDPGGQGCNGEFTTYAPPGSGLPAFIQITVPQVSNNNGMATPYNVPIFAQAAQATPGVSGQTADTVEVTGAVYNGSTIVVTATSSGACNALTASYGAVTSVMSGTTTCTATLMYIAYPAGGTTVDVTTSNPAGTDVHGYPITNQPSSAAGEIAFTGLSYTASEGGGVATVTVARTGGASGAASVKLATANGTGLAGTHYTATSGTLSWADSDMADKTFTIPVQNDAVYGGDRTVNLTLSSPVWATLSTPRSAVLTIVDDETPSTLAFKTASYSVNEAGVTATITVSRVGASVGVVGVHYATSNGTALAGTDYTATSGDLSWAAGNMADKTFTIPIADDAFYQGNLTVNLTLSAATGPAIIGGLGSAVLTIVDSESPSVLAFSAATYAVTESGVTATITATRTGPTVSIVTVNYATSNGTGQAGTDYTATSGILSWANGDAANKTFTIPITDDAVYQGNLTVHLALSTPTGSAVIGSQSTAVLTINENESGLSFSAPTYSVNENGTTATITVTRVGPSAGIVGCTYATANGAAIAGSDYTAKTGTLSWANGDLANKTFTVSITDDALYQGDLQFNLALSLPTGAAAIASQGTAVVTIVDDESTLNFSAPTYTVGEEGTTALITVERVGSASGTVGISYATANGTATAAADYTAKSGTLSWVGVTGAKTFTVSITNDTALETDETVNLTLSAPTGKAVIGSQGRRC